MEYLCDPPTTATAVAVAVEQCQLSQATESNSNIEYNLPRVQHHRAKLDYRLEACVPNVKETPHIRQQEYLESAPEP
jgi:ABC-type Zn2+ transport system substrate-binding protein/surface adhesin